VACESVRDVDVVGSRFSSIARYALEIPGYGNAWVHDVRFARNVVCDHELFARNVTGLIRQRNRRGPCTTLRRHAAPGRPGERRSRCYRPPFPRPGSNPRLRLPCRPEPAVRRERSG
jgi:hypothetical protein